MDGIDTVNGNKYWIRIKMLALKKTIKKILSNPVKKSKHTKPKKSKGTKLDKQSIKATNKPATDNTQVADAQILIGFPNHLFQINQWESSGIDITVPTHFVLYEHQIFYGHRVNPGKLNYNKIRLIYVRAAVLAYIDYLNSQITTGKSASATSGLVSVSFVSVDECLKNRTALSVEIAKIAKSIITKHSGAKLAIKYWDPVDAELSHDVMKGLIGNTDSRYGDIQKLDSQLFMTPESDLAIYHSKHNTGRFTHSAFYDWQKTRPSMKEYKFPGHSYDTENRGQMPQTTSIPPLPKLTQGDTKYLMQAEKYISAHQEWGAKTRPGASNTIANIVFPVTHAATHDWFQNFLTKKLNQFGKYQDSIDGKARNYLFHSCISPMMNLGLITPSEVVAAAHKYYHAHSAAVGVANYEGFIRQVIGWREYQRYIYLYAGPKMRQSNHFGNHAKLTPAWYSGKLGVRPVDDAIKMAFRDGYLHHILRLMVMGNFMNLAGLHPDEVYRWFMEFALDSYDWVMIGNVYSMALWADGGLSMRKPYISSDTYIMTLGTYTKETTGVQNSEPEDESSSSESDSNSSASSSSSSSASSSSNSKTDKTRTHKNDSKSLGWNRIWYALFYDFINRCQTQLKSTYYAGLVKAWNNKSQTDKQEIFKDAKLIISDITK